MRFIIYAKILSKELNEDIFYKLLEILEDWKEDTYSKNIISSVKMNKTILKNIQEKMSIFYKKRLDDLEEKEDIKEELLGDINNLINDPVDYLSDMKQLEKISDRQTIRFAEDYIKEMKYQRNKERR